MLTGLILTLAGTPALAGGAQCKQCCNDAGLYSCPTWLRIYGPGSQAKADIGGVRITGLWRLDCETGARFEEAGTVVVASRPSDGDVLLVGSPILTVECFRDWCSLPAGACLQSRPGGGMALLRCTDGLPLTATQLVTEGAAAPAVYAPPQPTPNPQAVRPPRPTAVSTVIVSGGGGTDPTPVPSYAAPPSTVIIETMTPDFPPHLPAEGPLPVVMDYDLPAAPGSRCKTSEVVAGEATRRLDLGDDSRLRGDHQQAAEEYRAAVTLDRCNAIAWAALGQLALSSDNIEKAVYALEVATALRPDHYGALTSLGLAYEASGRNGQARDAFTRALSRRPGHPAAEDGLGRVRGLP